MFALIVNFSYFLSLAIFCSLVGVSVSSLILSQVGIDRFGEYASYLKFTYNLRNHISNFSYLQLEGVYSPSSFVYDVDCFSIVRTNRIAEVDCMLPPRCGGVQSLVLNVSMFGQETKLCYSLHRSTSVDSIEIYKLKFKKIEPFHCNFDFEGEPSEYLEDLVPVDFFDYLRIELVAGELLVKPACCYYSYTRADRKLPDNVLIQENSDSFCVLIKNQDKCDCEGLKFASPQQLVRYFNFPIAYRYNPYDMNLHVQFRNQDPNVLRYVKDNVNNTVVYLFSVQEGGFFVSHHKMGEFTQTLGNQSQYIYYDANYRDSGYNYNCLKKKYVYKNPLSSLAIELLSLVRPIIYSILEFLEDELQNLIELFVKMLCTLSVYLLEKLINYLGSVILDLLILTFPAYYHFRDFYIVFGFVVMLYLFKLLIIN